MVLGVNVIPDQWSSIQEYSRESLNDLLRIVIAPNLTKFDDIQRTVVKLPRTTTKAQRHFIHRLTTSTFNSMSYDDQHEDRIMEITLEKSYVQELFRNYNFEPVQHVNVQIEPLSEKQKLFNTLISFINANLESEFNEYINSF